MGRTHRHQKQLDIETEGEIVNFRSKRKGKQSRKERKGKAKLSNLVTFQSQRHIPNQPNDETIAAMEEILNANDDCFDSVEELLKDLNDEPDKT